MASPSSSPAPVAISESRLKSSVWMFFKKLTPDMAECQICAGDTKAKKVIRLSKKSTSGMLGHLKAYHKAQFQLVVDQKNPSNYRSRQCAAIMVDTPSVPPSLFRSSSFLALFPEVEWHNFPSATALTTAILPDMVADITSKNRVDLSSLPVSLLVDSWTSRPLSIGGRTATEPVTIIVVLAYYINATWEMEGRLIAVRRGTDEPTPSVVRALLEQIIVEEGLDVVAVVSDGALNLRIAVESLGYRHLRCANHELSAAVSRGLRDWSEGSELMHRLREFARDLNEPHSGELRDIFFRQCALYSLRATTLPCSSSSTRWGGDTRLIEAALEQLPAISDTLAATGQSPFSANDAATLKAAAEALQPFGTLGLELSQEGRLFSESLFVLRKLEKHLESSSSSSCSLYASILSHFSSLTPRFFSSPSALSSVFFDPGAVFHFKGEVNWRAVAASISPTLPAPSSSSVASPTPPSACLSSRRAALYGDEKPPVKRVKREAEPSSGLDAELLLYLEQTLAGIDVTLEPLDFWRTNQEKYPHLCPLARRYLSSPPSSIDAEKVLSAAGVLFHKTLDNLLLNGNMEDICMLRLGKMGSLRALSHARDRVIVSRECGVDATAPEEVDEAPEPEAERDPTWDREDDERQGNNSKGSSSCLFSGEMKEEIKEELPDTIGSSNVA